MISSIFGSIPFEISALALLTEKLLKTISNLLPFHSTYCSSVRGLKRAFSSFFVLAVIESDRVVSRWYRGGAREGNWIVKWLLSSFGSCEITSATGIFFAAFDAMLDDSISLPRLETLFTFSKFIRLPRVSFFAESKSLEDAFDFERWPRYSSRIEKKSLHRVALDRKPLMVS